MLHACLLELRSTDRQKAAARVRGKTPQTTGFRFGNVGREMVDTQTLAGALMQTAIQRHAQILPIVRGADQPGDTPARHTQYFKGFRLAGARQELFRQAPSTHQSDRTTSNTRILTPIKPVGLSTQPTTAFDGYQRAIYQAFRLYIRLSKSFLLKLLVCFPGHF